MNVLLRTSLFFGLLIILSIACSDERDISFNEDIRPILNENCLSCHGGVRAQGDFSLLFEEDALSINKSGKAAIVRGNHKKSPLYQRLVHEDPEMKMPFEKPALNEEQIQLIADWIDQGAEWETHWAYILPDRAIQPPELENDWSTNGIDKFVLRKLNSHDRTPNLKADQYDLVRRIYIDLIGIPPTTNELEKFISNTSETAYENLVDELLASPHFGERWASMWLDLARYADSKGYEKDVPRSIWKYRDWVVKAFNEDMPYNKFTVHQLAGDLLPIENEDQLIATAYHRNTMDNDEGGTDDEEFRAASIIERVGNTYEVWQGTTMACTQCHSHPYDPFRHKDFYTSMAYFNNVKDRDVYNSYPKLYSYDQKDTAEVNEIVNWINSKVDIEDRVLDAPIMYERSKKLLDNLDDFVVEAEDYIQSSALLELMMPDLDMLWQVQDSSWIYFQDVHLDDIESISFKAASTLDFAGTVKIHLDSINGPEIGSTEIRKTGSWDSWQWRKPKEESQFKYFKTDIKETAGTHDMYYKFYVGDTYIQHLFYIDKIVYHKKEKPLDKYGVDVSNKLQQLRTIAAHTTPITGELSERRKRETRIYNRGSWLQPTDTVSRNIPAVFNPSGKEIKDRLAFSNWIISEENPLTARVIVNRIWEQIFGNGLVATMEEFGSQGDKPSHPELLDWLANRLQYDHKWSLKKLIKDMVMSSTYRQSSSADSASIASDPNNVLLSRYQRTRLSAEQIRDQVLHVSGLLNTSIGGASIIFPSMKTSFGNGYIPSWADTSITQQYRRSLYGFWKRTDPQPGMITFDSPDRTVCSSKRIRTNTPLQALNLLNDETFFKASAALAQQMLYAESELEKQITYGYKQVLCRPIDEVKINLLTGLYLEAQEHYQNNLELLDHRDVNLGAMTMVANTLLNLDEFIVKS